MVAGRARHCGKALADRWIGRDSGALEKVPAIAATADKFVVVVKRRRLETVHRFQLVLSKFPLAVVRGWVNGPRSGG